MPNQSKQTASKIASRFIRDECGATAVEYGVMIAAIAAIIITIVFSVGFKVNDAFTHVDTELGNVTQP